MSFLDIFINILIAAIFSGLIIWIVGKLGLGLEVDGYGPAYLAAVVIAVLALVVLWLLSLIGFTGFAWGGALVNLIVAAAVLLLAGRWIKGLRVNGFGGAIVAAISIGVVTWLVNWVLSLF